MAYMDKERAESARRYKESLEWLREVRAETERRRKEHLAKHRDFEKTLGKL